MIVFHFLFSTFRRMITLLLYEPEVFVMFLVFVIFIEFMLWLGKNARKYNKKVGKKKIEKNNSEALNSIDRNMKDINNAIK